MTDIPDSASCVCGHANREHAAFDAVDGRPCYDTGCGCQDFMASNYSAALKGPVPSALSYAIVGVLFKHDPMMTLSAAMSVADEIASRITVDEYIELEHRGTGSDLMRIKEGLGYYGDHFRILPAGIDKITATLTLKGDNGVTT